MVFKIVFYFLFFIDRKSTKEQESQICQKWCCLFLYVARQFWWIFSLCSLWGQQSQFLFFLSKVRFWSILSWDSLWHFLSAFLFNQICHSSCGFSRLNEAEMDQHTKR
jgi:hypothetical protein